MSLYIIIKVSPLNDTVSLCTEGELIISINQRLLSLGTTWLKREMGRQWHLAVINEVTFPTALAEL